MPVDEKHPEYSAYETKWLKCRVCVEGEESVKAAAETFLPRLEGQKNEEYNAYKMRASFFAGTARAVNALGGMLFKRKPRVEATKELLEILKTVTEEKTDLDTFTKYVAQEVVTTGRVCVLVDAAAEALNGRPYLTAYSAESIINWKTEVDEEGNRGLSLLVFYEKHYEPEDDFSHTSVPQIRVLSLQENKYTVRLFREREKPDPNSGNPNATKKEWVLEETLIPMIRGKALEYIPAVIIGVTDVAPDVEKPPMLDVAEVNLSLYRSSADLEHGRHFTALPTAWVSGDINEEANKGGLRVGSTTAWLLESGEQAGYLEFTGQGLSSLEKAITEKKNDMAVLGARILLSDPNFQEAEGTLRMRKLGEGSIAASIASTVSVGMTMALKWWQMWLQGRETLEMALNTDYVGTALDATLLEKLMVAVMQKQLSWETLWYNVKKSDLVPEERTPGEEIELINSGGPSPLDGIEEPEDEDPEDEDDPENED